MVQFCPELVSNGVCLTEGCTFNHNLVMCELCKIFCSNDGSYQQHLRGKQHRKAVQRAESGEQHSTYRCGVCQVLVSTATRAQPERGRQHRRNAALYESGEQPADIAQHPDAPYCSICSAHVTDDWDRHMRSPKHLLKERYASYHAAFSESETDKYGVVISRDEGDIGVDFGTIEPDSLEANSTLSRQLRVESSTSSVVLTQIRMSSDLKVWRTRKFV